MPSTKVTKDLPIQLADVGSREAQGLDFTREALWKRMDGGMGRKAVQTPVFLANPRQMDYLYPPERLRFLHPEQVRRWAQEVRERREREGDEGEPLQGLEPERQEEYREVVEEEYREVVAVGLYVSRLDDAQKRELLHRAEGDPEEEALRRHAGPAIFLCPERILSWAGREGVSPNLVLDKVYYHELGHALMDTGTTPYQELWCRIVEESLANWIAFRRFSGKEARLVQRLIAGQPPEYQGYLAVEEVPWGFGGEDWERLWEEWRWHWYRALRELPSHWRLHWEEWLFHLRHLARRGFPFPYLLFGVHPEGEPVARLNLKLWKEAKEGGFSQTEQVRLWALFARTLLLRTVD
ncbi:hypothetical protein Mlute_02821 [Meiothermus luteus]|jgi:hypothetical protein|uniref:Uncharacterized protein n=1 Tax=Meiothermus luteus TaxID=2026184 RepID=A0A399EEF5_9DEIN|nr:hypothetical protein [Meiothermus luteus]RIH81370.1 hypothetical protein Mlute_02821 [Meiothermus luteus]